MMTLTEILADIRSDRVKKVILDTDAFNEIDDQYALAYCYLSDAIDLLSVNAVPFHNDRSDGFEDGMLKSYDEIHHILGLIDPDYTVPVYHGSRTTIEVSGGIVDSPAARNIIDTVKASEEIVYVLAIGAITNVASALAMEPCIKDKMCVIWLGANWLQGDNVDEFNLMQDYTAGQMFLNSGVPLVLCPAWCVVSELKSNIALTRDLLGRSAVCDYLGKITEREYIHSGCDPKWTRIIWDIAAPAIIECPACAELEILPTPVLTDSRAFAFDSTRHKMIYLRRIDRDMVFDAAWKALKGGSRK